MFGVDMFLHHAAIDLHGAGNAADETGLTCIAKDRRVARAFYDRVDAVRASERDAKLDRIEGYTGFTKRVEAVREGMLAFLEKAKAEGKSVAAYGAAAKGNTLLNYCKIGPDLIQLCVDRNPAKQNTLLPGSQIPVKPVEALYDFKPDYVVILPWNLKTEITSQLSDLAPHGTRFVTAVPEISIN